MRARVGALVLSLALWGCAGSGVAIGENQDAGQKDSSHVEVGYICTVDDDCAALNVGRQFCTGLFTCDVTGNCRVVSPPSCDDGVACTDDICDLATDQCQNVPNNDKCPTDFPICFVQFGCQQAQPCEHDSECDDSLWCNGTESCVQGHCASSIAPDCDDHDPCTIDACDEATNACTHTHQQLTGVTDHPDHDFVDANCDGIDGDIAKSIFVAPPPLGADTNPGTMASPVATIAKGIELATPQKYDVLVALGTYSETVTMVAGVSVYGGYDSTDGWKRYHYTPMAATIIMGGVTAVKFQAIAEQTELQLVAVASTKSFTAGASSVGISVVSSTGPILLTDCVVVAGNGADGGNGAGGTTGATGGVGGNAVQTTRGGSGTSSCAATGGAGGNGIGGTNTGNPGQAGTTVPGGGVGQSGGSGGGAGACSSTASEDGHPADPVGVPLQPGGNGGAGTNGNPGAAFGTLDAAGTYSPPAGGAGQGAGHPGGGGAGGGAGGGSAHGSSIWQACLDCQDVYSGAGGGGGGGGCGGTVGSGGNGGGASFGIVVVNSVATITGCKLTSGLGGNGGIGGDGGQGGAGGGGGSGAAGLCNSNDCSTRCGGAGHAGGKGGDGGRGGAGAGGTGGASVCIVYKGTAPTTTANTCVNGGGGAGGAGGTNGTANAPSGATGVVADVRSG